MLIVHNFERFPDEWTAANGASGKSVFVRDLAGYLRHRQNRDALFLVNSNPKLTLNLALQQLLFPFAPLPLIAVDLVLRRPQTSLAKAKALIKRALYKRVDYFIHSFRDVQGLNEVFGIDPERSGFVPFKVNLWEQRESVAQPDGDYVLCFGRSLSDFDTFFAAMEQLPYPGAIVDPIATKLWDFGGRFTREVKDIPSMVNVVACDLSAESQAALLRNAKIVVLPILKTSIVASGLRTALNAMALGTCVISSAGPGVTDIFTDEIASVPPEDPAALAAKIRDLWEHDERRASIAQAGFRYALLVGGESEFYQRIIDDVAAWSARKKIS